MIGMIPMCEKKKSVFDTFDFQPGVVKILSGYFEVYLVLVWGVFPARFHLALPGCRFMKVT